MANPQAEDGHTRIANEILEALICFGLNGTELGCILFVIRKTYGWGKPNDIISLTQFEKAVKSSRPAICKAIKKLQLVNILLLVNKSLLGNSYAFNKDHESWVVNKPLLVNKSKSASKQNEMKVVNKPLHTKETITKETIQKKHNALLDFWNGKNITRHANLKPDIESAIKKALKDYSVEDIEKAIETYSIIYHGAEYYFKHKWTLAEFLSRSKGLPVFLCKVPKDYLTSKPSDPSKGIDLMKLNLN